MSRAYNVWFKSEYRWTYEEPNGNPHYGGTVKRLSLEEAKRTLYYCVGRPYPAENAHYILLEMDLNNNPIVPKCLKLPILNQE